MGEAALRAENTRAFLFPPSTRPGAVPVALRGHVALGALGPRTFFGRLRAIGYIMSISTLRPEPALARVPVNLADALLRLVAFSRDLDRAALSLLL